MSKGSWSELSPAERACLEKHSILVLQHYAAKILLLYLGTSLLSAYIASRYPIHWLYAGLLGMVLTMLTESLIAQIFKRGLALCEKIRAWRFFGVWL